MKRTLSLALALLLVLSVASGVASLAEGEKRVLTMGGVSSTWDFLGFDSYQKMQDDLGITIEYTYYNDDSFSAMLAGGDLPDLVVASQNMDIVIGNGLALDLTPYLDQLPNLTGDQYGATLELTRGLWGGEEKGVYVLCPVVGPHCWNGGTYMTERGYGVNWEYYKEIGCPEITDDDSYIEVLKQMYANHPTADDGSPAYLFGVQGTLAAMGGFRASFRADIAVNPWSKYLYNGSTIDNHLVNCMTDVEHSSYWADMEFYNKLYRTGLWDMDCFTMTKDEYVAKLDKNAYMGIYECWRSQQNYVTVPSKNATVYCDLILPMGNAPGQYTFVSKDTKNLDLVLAYINYMYDPDFNRLVYSGVQGKDWDYDESGAPALTDESISARAAGDPYWSSTGNGYGYRWWYTNAYNPAVNHTDGYPMDLAFTPEALIATQTERMKEFCEIYGVDFWYDAYTKLGVTTFVHDAGEPIDGAITDIPMDIKRTLETCSDILYTAMPTLIMTESDEEFAAVREETLAELADAGEADAWAWYSAAWEEPMKLFNDYLDATLPKYGK